MQWVKMMLIKNKIKTIISKCGKKISIHTDMSKIEARNILQNWSPCPNGGCKVKNEIDLQYDLQVIIPAYNAQEFVEECINSILVQKTKYRCLVTVVDDGSKDRTSKILPQYIQKDVIFSNRGGYH